MSAPDVARTPSAELGTRLPPVLMMGPALEVRGGVSRVEALIMEGMRGRASMTHVATMVDGGPVARMAVFSGAVRALRRALRDPVIVHIHFASRGSTLRKMLLARMVLRAGRTLVMHAHGAGYREFYAGLPVHVQRSIRTTLLRADRLIVLSDSWKRFYVESLGIPSGQVCVMRNPIVVPGHLPPRPQRVYVTFLFLGRIGERKGAFELMRAFDALEPAVRDRARLVLAGDGSVERARALHETLESRSSIDVRGWVAADERDALLQSSDVVVLPSRNEGVPMSVLESMAVGLPAIATPVGGVPEILTDGENGLLVPVGDPAALQRALTVMVEQPVVRERLGAAARRRAREYDLPAYCDRLTAIYAEASGTPAAAR